MRLLAVLLLALLAACDRGVTVTYRVSMASAEADSISQLSVAISGAVAQRHAMEAQGTPGGRAAACAAYRASLPGLERKEARAPALPGQLGAQQVRDALKRCAQA